MSERIMTLFGEEIVPEQLKAVGKSRAKKKPGEKKEEDEVKPGQNEPDAITLEQEEPVAIIPGPGQPAAETPEQKEPEAAIPEEEPVAAAQVQEEPAAILSEQAEVAAVTHEQTEFPVAILDEAGAEITEPAIEQNIAAESQPVEPPQELPAAKKRKTKAEAKSGEENIILPEDWHGDKQYYSIGEVAELFNVKTSHIRFWTNEFKLKVRTTRKGDRLFTPEQIMELRAIHHLVKERGFTLTGAKAKLKAQNNRDVQTVDLKQSLLQLRNKLVIIKNQLT